MISVTQRTVQTALTMRMTPFVLYRRLGEQKGAGKQKGSWRIERRCVHLESGIST